MSDIRIDKDHAMSFDEAREVAARWAEQAQEKFDMHCSYERGEDADQLSFTRSGVSGTLTVTGERFELQAKLGFLLSAFRERIEAEIRKNLDAMVASHGAAGRDAAA
jgi:putative polyhydroxyalkanoate system protein